MPPKQTRNLDVHGAITLGVAASPAIHYSTFTGTD